MILANCHAAYRMSPTVYVSFYPPAAFDGCGNLIATSVEAIGSTQTFGAGALSTVAQPSGATTPIPQEFDFSDLPCPPPNIQNQLEPGAAYSPLLYLADRTDFWVSSEYQSCNISNVKDGNYPAVPATVISASDGFFSPT